MPISLNDTKMSSETIEKVLQFFVSKLPEDQLEELDALLDSGSAAKPAMDAVMGTQERRDYLAIGARARNAIRASKRRHHASLAADSAENVAYRERFPHSGRLAG